MTPVKMWFSYRDMSIVLPTNPEHLKIDRASSAIKTEIATLGEIGIPTTPALATIKIESLFWYDRIQEIDEKSKRYFYQYPKTYVSWFRFWQLTKEPARFSVEGLGFKHYDMWVTCESFNYDVKAGEEQDIYYELSLSEFRAYGAKIIQPPANETNGNQVLKPSPPRIDNKPPVPATYVIQPGDSLVTISLRLTGTDTRWRELYDTNINTIGANPKLTPGTVILIPESWRSLKSLSYSE